METIMGTRKQWTGKEKLAIVLQGLKGTCNALLDKRGALQSDVPPLSKKS